MKLFYECDETNVFEVSKIIIDETRDFINQKYRGYDLGQNYYDGAVMFVVKKLKSIVTCSICAVEIAEIVGISVSSNSIGLLKELENLDIKDKLN